MPSRHIGMTGGCRPLVIMLLTCHKCVDIIGKLVESISSGAAAYGNRLDGATAVGPLYTAVGYSERTDDMSRKIRRRNRDIHISDSQHPVHNRYNIL